MNTCIAWQLGRTKTCTGMLQLRLLTGNPVIRVFTSRGSWPVRSTKVLRAAVRNQKSDEDAVTAVHGSASNAAISDATQNRVTC